MIERITSLTPEKAYEELKNLLFRNNCRIVFEEYPKRIEVEQGSLLSITPRGVKKRISFTLLPHNSGARIVAISSFTRDWESYSILSYMLCIIIAFLLGWMSIELEVLAERGIFAVFYWYCRIASILLLIIVVVGIIIDLYLYARRNSFSEEVLRLIP
jgi:hypothetical protein